MVELAVKDCFLNNVLMNAESCNYNSDDYYDLLINSANMTGLDNMYNKPCRFSKERLYEFLYSITEDCEFAFKIQYLYNFFTGDNPAFRRLIIKYTKEALEM